MIMGSHLRFFISCAIAAVVCAGGAAAGRQRSTQGCRNRVNDRLRRKHKCNSDRSGALEAALLEKDETRIYAAARRYQEALGDYAGVPEDREQCVLPLVTTRPVAVGAKFASDFNATAQLAAAAARSLKATRWSCGMRVIWRWVVCMPPLQSARTPLKARGIWSALPTNSITC